MNKEIQNILRSTSFQEEAFAKVDMQSIIESVEKNIQEDSNPLMNKTTQDIANEMDAVLQELSIPSNIIQTIKKRLTGYRFIDQINELNKSRHIRWIKRKTPTVLTNGAILMNIKFTDNETHLVCKNVQNQFFQIKFDECLIFQKMTVEEQLVLTVYEYISTN